MNRRVWILCCVLVCASGCLPYGVGSTAATVAPGRYEQTVIVSTTPRMASVRNEVNQEHSTSMDGEMRTGLDQRTDVGIRVSGGSGLIISYKRRLSGEYYERTVAMQLEGGALHLGGVGMLGATLMASARERDSFTPFAGLRGLVVAPMRDGYPSRPPAIGAYMGGRIGPRDLSITPEVAIFRDRVRNGYDTKQGVLIVPTVSFNVQRILDAIRPPR